MTVDDYRFITHWRVRGTVEEVSDVLRDGASLSRWWPSLYRESTVVRQGDESGRGGVVAVVNHAWLPYNIHWQATIESTRHPYGYTLRARGEFEGTGEWTFVQDGEWVDITYDWQVRVGNPAMRLASRFVKPLLESNHNWGMRLGERSLELELQRRRARTDEERAAVPAPPGPISPLWWVAGAAVLVQVVAAAVWLGRRKASE